MTRYADFNGEDFGESWDRITVYQAMGYKEGVDKVVEFLDGQRFGLGDPVACIKWALKEGLL